MSKSIKKISDKFYKLCSKRIDSQIHDITEIQKELEKVDNVILTIEKKENNIINTITFNKQTNHCCCNIKNTNFIANIINDDNNNINDISIDSKSDTDHATVFLNDILQSHKQAQALTDEVITKSLNNDILISEVVEIVDNVYVKNFNINRDKVFNIFMGESQLIIQQYDNKNKVKIKVIYYD